MDSKVLKVVLACALGGGVGSLVALSVHHYFWWVGLLVGGIVGYLSYDFREVFEALKTSFGIAWRKMVAREFRAGMLKACAIFTVPLAVSASLATVYLSLNNWGREVRVVDGTDIYVVFAVGGSTLVAVTWYTTYILSLPFYKEKRMRNKTLLKIAFFLTPLGLPVIAVVVPLLALGWAVIKSPKAAKFCWVFSRTFFLLIHSDIRLLCAADAIIGATAGFFFASPLIGAVVGVAAGVANYKLVSQRILRLHLRTNGG